MLKIEPTAWFPTYWNLFHDASLVTAGLMAGMFTIYGSLIGVPGGSLSDRFSCENIAMLSFTTMAVGGAVLTLTSNFEIAFLGMMILGTGMGIANAAVFELVPKFIPDAVGGASGWIDGGGAGILIILPVLGNFVDVYGQIG